MVINQQQAQMTVEAFWEAYAGKPFELIHGQVREIMPAGGESPEIELLLGGEIARFVIRNKLGKTTGAEGGYWLNETTLRAPDVAFYGWAKHKLHTDPDKYRPFPPDLAVEVVSPTDAAEDVLEKTRIYLDAGVSLVWVVYPRAREIVVYQADGVIQRLTESDALDGGDVLPGFTLLVAACFPPQEEASEESE